MSIEKLYHYSNLPKQSDFACAGFFIININIHSKIMYDYFFEIEKDPLSITSGGDQTHFNYFAQSRFNVNWLSYKFQTIWSYEAANYYPHVFYVEWRDISLVSIQNSLRNSYFLHFAGSWSECELWKNSKIFGDGEYLLSLSKYYDFLLSEKHGIPLGKISPKQFEEEK
jgi:hypothetical protein